MSQQISVKRDKDQPNGALWWRPVFSMQKELNHSLREMFSNMIPSIGGTPIMLWNTEENMFDAYQRNAHRVFSELFNNRQMATPWFTGSMTEPYVDIIENGEAFKIKADVPGLNMKDLDVSVAENAITITGDRCEEKQTQDETYLRKECHCGTFSRTIALPEEADVDKAKASFEHNVLTVVVPKKKEPAEQDTGRKLKIQNIPASKKTSTTRS